MTVDWKHWHEEHLRRIEEQLHQIAESFSPNISELPRAMQYALMAGGKRIRPLLVYATYELGSQLPQLQQAIEQVDQAAGAIELMHTYSLVHDDLPTMDNDDFRRGKPTTHKVFDEATALLVGDALQAESFYILSRLEIPAQIKILLIKELAMAAGVQGMAGGQAFDLGSVGKPLNQDALEQMHLLKTGALLKCAIQSGALLGGLTSSQQLLLVDFAAALGLGFQVVDDILDATQDSATLGKTAGKDLEAEKPTYVSLLGVSGAKAYSEQLLDKALTCLENWGVEAELLRAITQWVFKRNK
ncbi:MAG: polyprenyl synthetase family protein [Betaproteobacteria bacterium]|jgi:farnesyl diphosphate synthase